MIPYVNSPGANVKQAKIFTQAASKYAPGAGTPNVPGTTPTVTDTTTDTTTPPVDPNFYANAIKNDSLYQQDQKDLSAQGIEDTQGTAAGIMRALVKRGLVPDLQTAANTFGLSPNVVNFLKNNLDFSRTSALAQQATDSGVSLEAQLANAHQTNLGGIKDRLAARGLAESGASPSLMGREANDYKIQRFNADQATSDFINGAISAFATAERGRQKQLRDSASAAAERQRKIAGSTPPPAPPPPPPDPNSNPEGDYLKALIQAARTRSAVNI